MRVRAGQQPLHSGDLSLPRPTANQNHDAGMLAFGPQFKEVIAIAGHENGTVGVRPSPNFGVGRRYLQHVPEADDGMAAMAKPVCQVVRNVLIEEKGHFRGSRICPATKSSISAR